ncbi:MAG: tetratricopeptide repeat protein [Bacteroidota bacterium]
MITNNWYFILPLFALLSLVACQEEKPISQAEKVNPVATANPENALINSLSFKIADNPKDADLYAQRAQAFYDKEGYDEAITDLQEAIRLDSTNLNYPHLLADVYMDYFKSRKAIQTMERVVKRFPESIPSLLKISEFYLIIKQHDNALKSIDQLLKLDAQNAEAYFMLGRIFEDMGDQNRAINSYQTAVENDPDLHEVWVKLGNLFASKENKLAIQYYENALRVAPENIDALFAKATYLHNQGQLNEAIENYKALSKVDPQYADAYYNMGLAYMELDSIQEAYMQFDLTVKMKPTHIMGYYYRGVAAESRGEREAAMNDYQQALNLYPSFDRAQQALDKLKAESQQ